MIPRSYDSWKTRSPDDNLSSPDDEEPSLEQQRMDYEDEMTVLCDACGADGDIRLAGDLLKPHKFACRKCMGIWTTNWFYLRRPGDFDDDAAALSSHDGKSP